MADIKVSAKLPDAPRNGVHVYRLKATRVNESAIRSLARTFGMRAAPEFGTLCSDAEKLVYHEGHLELSLFRASGGMRLIDRSRWQIDDRKSDLRITDAEASRLAANAIRKRKLAPATQMRFLKAARLRVGHATRDGREVAERTIDVAVAMQRMVDKIPVDGPGGKIIVYLDHGHQPTGFERLWRDLGATHRRNQPCRGAESALDDMTRHFRTKQGTVEIQEVRYGYFEEGWRNVQRYLQPAYIFFGMIGTPGSNVRKRTIYVASALVDPVGAITPPLRKKRAQKARPAGRGHTRDST